MIVLGTAGHIDHGKTTLVKALTGIETDRLKVEQERGITTELGFAHLDLPGGQRVSIIDAPGHERFVRHMIAGAGGLDVAMLVVAADEGVMPQTREHLDILGLVGVARGLVFVTKCDLVPPDDLELALDDIRAGLDGTFLAGAPVLTFAATRPETFAGLRARLGEVILGLFPAPPERPADRPFRMAIDRVFTMTGFGAVLTGTVTAGQVSTGAEVEVLPSGLRGRVRTLQQHGEALDRVGPGMRAAINVQGVATNKVERGEVLTTPGALRTGAALDATVRLLRRAEKPLKRRTAATVHTGTVQVEAIVALIDRDELPPGEACNCQLRLAHPIATLAGDPYVLRGFEILPGYGRTVGGGRILQPDAPFRRGAAAVAAAPLLAALRDGDATARLRALVELSGASGLAAPDLLARSDLGQRALNRTLGPLVSSGRVVHFQHEGVTRYAGAEACERLSEALLAALAAAHERHPDRDGIPVEELRGALPSRPEIAVLSLALGRLAAAGRVREVAPGAFALPGHSARSSRVGEDLLSRVEAVFGAAGLSPPYPDEAAAALGLPPEGVRDAVTSLVRQGRLVRVTGAAGEQPLHFHAPALAGARERLVAHLEARPQIAMAAFKDLLGVTRKYAIPLAEHFDSAHVTLRMPDGTRKLRRT